MKVYVEGYTPVTSLPPTPQRANRQDYGVGYSSEPSWTMPSRAEADGECARLRSFHVRVGEHACEFEVEQTEFGEFAIICPTHPVLGGPKA